MKLFKMISQTFEAGAAIQKKLKKGKCYGA
jgi:hypothetical protein